MLKDKNKEKLARIVRVGLVIKSTSTSVSEQVFILKCCGMHAYKVYIERERNRPVSLVGTFLLCVFIRFFPSLHLAYFYVTLQLPYYSSIL